MPPMHDEMTTVFNTMDLISSLASTSSSASSTSSKRDPAELPQAFGAGSARKDDQPDVRVFTLKDHSILRGVRSDVVLRRRASLLGNANGSLSTFQLSQPADHLDAFISHNWCVSRGKKWLALSLHFYLFAAVVGALLSAAMVALMVILGLLPLFASDGRRDREGVCCRLFGSLVFGSLVLFWPDFKPRRCSWHPQLFLDKCCIHQVDLDLQRAGIESLGAFLFYSWSLVVLYTRVYTQVVWTVYEMACFLLLHPEGHLVWLHVNLPTVVLVGSVAALLGVVTVFTSQLTSVRRVVPTPDYIMMMWYLPCALVIAFLFRRVSRDHGRTWSPSASRMPRAPWSEIA